MTIARIYVGTYEKYNRGSIEGKWLDLADYASAEEFNKTCLAIHADERFPELMFQDWENVPDRFISESCFDAKEYYDYQELLENSHLDAEVFAAGLAIDIEPENIEDAYHGEYENDVDFAQQLAEEMGAIREGATWPHTHVDWERAAADLMWDFTESDGHYFSNNY